MKTKTVVVASLLAVGTALLSAAPAMAGGVNWSVNIGVPAVVPVAPMAPAAVYAPPMRPVVVAPPPVVYAPPPPPVYYQPGVAVVGYPYYAPPPRHPGWHHPHPRRWD